jgi:rod shape determining protein RodA
MLAKVKKMDWPILVIALVLTGIGMLALASAAPVSPTAWGSIVVRQTVFLVGAMAVFVATIVPHYLRFKRCGYAFYVGVLVLLVVLLVFPGVDERRGVRRWFDFGVFTLQPSELAKLAVVLVLARHLMYRENMERWSALLVPALLLVVPMLLVLLQPDLGTALVFIPVLFVMLYVAGARKLHLVVAALVILAAAPLSYHFALKDYQRKRIDAFIRPDASPQGVGYQTLQAQAAVGAGQMLGKGWRNSAPYGAHTVPERHNDFIFVVLAEEFGFLGASLVMLLNVMLFALLVRVAYRTREPFGRLVVAGILTCLAMQTYVNMGMTVGMLPVTGITLPFVSYGGSSLVTCFLMLGLASSVSMRYVPMFDSKEFEYRLDQIRQVGLKGEGLELLAHELLERGK